MKHEANITNVTRAKRALDRHVAKHGRDTATARALEARWTAAIETYNEAILRLERASASFRPSNYTRTVE